MAKAAPLNALNHASKTSQYDTPNLNFLDLYRAVIFGQNKEIMSLINAKVDIEVRYKGVTALGCAIQNNNTSTVELLIDAGANVEAKSYDIGWTPLHHVAAMGHTAIVDLLLSRRASIYSIDLKGRTPIDLARLGGTMKLSSY